MSKRFELVGSLLRPADLLAYKHKIEHRDDITYPFYDDFEGYEACEAAATKDVVEKQIAHGIHILTDGEVSKSLWHLDFVWGLEGTERFIADHGYFFQDHDGNHGYETRKDIGIRIVKPLSGKIHNFIKVYQRLQDLAGNQNLKLTVPSPSHIYGELCLLGIDQVIGEGEVYKTPEDLKKDLAKSYKEFIDDYVAVGGKIIQFDDCLWQLFSSDNSSSPFSADKVNHEELAHLAQEFIDLNNDVIDYGHSKGLLVWTHNCRGNYDSHHMSDGSYETIANIFLEKQNYDRFFLEWDDDRAGSVSALSVLKDQPQKEVVLGVLSSKTRTLDDEDRCLALLNEAAAIIPKDRLYLSHQCGFASCDCGNDLTEEEQWAKIDQGQRLAQSFWGE
ncbi:cobalamin-independent methionine synthase II family protein [Peptococcus simiae]|uniref:Cobalamin-independent methionine synthase II family protein n=1 Tax=Peptococcus simiae TaxID=1643805 RepID=A0ABW9GYL4_9FIRM